MRRERMINLILDTRNLSGRTEAAKCLAEEEKNSRAVAECRFCFHDNRVREPLVEDVGWM